EHMAKEEEILFPAIKSLVSNQLPSQQSIKLIIKLMHDEHDHAGEDLKYLRTITDNYTLPADACNSYNYLFEKLKEFEDDLFKHIHLENNILFPKAVALEGK